MNADEFITNCAMIEADALLAESDRERALRRAATQPAPPLPSPFWTQEEHERFTAARAAQPAPVSREELVDFVRKICEGDSMVSSELVYGQRAIELAAWELYRRLQEAREI